MLEAAGLRLPTAIFAHGFLTVDGTKMSKSRGTFIKASTYLEHLDPEHLRYYFAAKLSAGVDDFDLNLTDFVQRVNSDLVGKVVNIASRCAGFLRKGFDNTLSEECAEPDLVESFIAAGEQIAALYENREFSRAMREIIVLADRANQYIDEKKPWVMAKDRAASCRKCRRCARSESTCIARWLTYSKAGVYQGMAERVGGVPAGQHSGLDLRCRRRWNGHCSRAPFQPLLQRVDAENVVARWLRQVKA